MPETAAAIGSSPATVRKWIFQNRIAAIRLGRPVRVHEAEILRVQREGLRAHGEVAR